MLLSIMEHNGGTRHSVASRRFLEGFSMAARTIYLASANNIDGTDGLGNGILREIYSFLD